MKIKDGDFPALTLTNLNTKIILDGEIASIFIYEAIVANKNGLHFSLVFCSATASCNLLKDRLLRQETDQKKQSQIISRVNLLTDGQFLEEFIRRNSKLSPFYNDVFYLNKLRNLLSAHIIPLGAYLEAHWGTHKDSFFRNQVIECIKEVSAFCEALSLKKSWDDSKLSSYTDSELHTIWIDIVMNIIPKLATDAFKRTEALFASYYSQSTVLQKLYREVDEPIEFKKLKKQLKLPEINLSKLPKSRYKK